MRYLLFLLFFTVSFFSSPFIVFAHENHDAFGVTLNGKSTTTNGISATTPHHQFPITEGLASESFLVNQPISFEVVHDANEDHAPFTWTFSDGQSFQEESGEVVFTKPGSYIATVRQEDNEKPITHTLLLHVLPEKDYELPRATFTIDGIQVPDEAYAVDLSTQLTFDARSSFSEGENARYLWYLDNGNIAEGETIVATYPDNPFLITPILRVIDENGIYTDTQVRLKNSQFEKNEKPSFPWAISSIGISIAVVTLGSVLFFLRKNASKKHSAN